MAGEQWSSLLSTLKQGVQAIGNLASVLGKVFPSSAGTTAPSATAGTNGAVPAQVAQYLNVSVNGQSFKIPLFNP